MGQFAIASLLAATLVTLLAFKIRGRFYGGFALVLLMVHTGLSVLLFNRISNTLGSALPVYLVLHTAVYLHLTALIWARPRPLLFRMLVSVPGLTFWAGTFLTLPWALVELIGLILPVGALPGLFIPFSLAAIGALQSSFAREEELALVLDNTHHEKLGRCKTGQAQDDRPLRIIQITDPHIGPFMSVARLRNICERTVARNPDLVLLTGDFLTMESHRPASLLSRALEPLKALEGRTFACLGNHDLEAPDTVEQALNEAGVQLLVDDATCVQTEAGKVQIVGANFVWKDRAAHLKALCEAHPRAPEHLRLLMLHDPAAFAQMPEGGADLVLSGHTHGGQLGLLSFGLKKTVVSAMTEIPDHGFWARGVDRLYVHRGTGHYGFPIRIGVPSEQSLISIHFEDRLKTP